jgi:hypothetical protein
MIREEVRLMKLELDSECQQQLHSCIVYRIAAREKLIREMIDNGEDDSVVAGVKNTLKPMKDLLRWFESCCLRGGE